MTGLTDLQNAVTGLTTEVGLVKTAVGALNAQIVTLQATIAAGGDNDADVEAQAKAISAQVAILDGIINPAPASTVAPTPAMPGA